MKRIHLFEFEDFPWFPNWLRVSMTRLIVVMHRLLGTTDNLANLLKDVIEHSGHTSIVDLCSGSGGPMVAVVKKLNESNHIKNLTLTLTDLYPDTKLVNTTIAPGVSYLDKPVDAANVPSMLTGIRTMVCSFHHMKPDVARKILIDAKKSIQPICIYEISDNSSPTALWWIALPFNFIIAFLITPFVRPLTLQQILFTYLIPIIPLFFAWDGAVSNARTYTLKDLDILLEGLQSDDYQWKKGVLPGKAKKIYLLGLPQ